MLNDFTGADKVYIACGCTDLRKGIDGLARLVQQQFELDPFTNTLFLFCGRRRDRIKGLYWEKDGFILLYKRLEQGAYQWPRSESEVEVVQKKLFGRSSEQAEQMVMEQLSFTYVPAGTGIQPLGLEAVPADDGQLAAEGFGEMAAADLRCAA